jgi:hypothetical protein
MILKQRGSSETEENLRQVMKKSWRSLPPTHAGAAPFCLVGGAAPVVVVARHGSWGCAGDWEKKA